MLDRILALVVEVKPGESITSIAVGWALESFVTLSPKGKVAKAEEPKKKEGKTKEAKAPAKTSSPKGKAAKPAAKAKLTKKAPAKGKPKKKK